MNPNPSAKPYLEQLRQKRDALMALPAMTPEQEKDVQRAKELQLEIVGIEARIGGTSLMPRRPKGHREAVRAELEEQREKKLSELDDVMRRISFIK